MAAERSIVEALTSRDIYECEFELRAELRQVLTNIYIELRRGFLLAWDPAPVGDYLPFECLRDSKSVDG